ncbi:aminodeoxychorismate synthase component I [Actinoplanes sp. NPDC051411]|uniref:aminodeoxychorismate synthase component I n=1 Tax=Actinoplanes sp. NPDC051411 TaxID=3155522 RepID=UPI00343D88D1
MQTLLIDNYDSYTYNLFQLIAEVNGAEPIVVRNDVGMDRIERFDFDNVVISPGPGHPDRPADFGICRQMIAETRVPLLGVCLGHQGIATAFGGRVTSAPQPRHGHLTRIRHDGTDLFERLPQDFQAVRYHSLHAEPPLPEELRAIAYAEDGVVMAVGHRSRPIWGIQFHPESIGTEYGAALLSHFRNRTPRRPRRTPRPISRTPKAPAAATKKYRVRVRVIDREIDSETAFVSLFGASPDAYWLDSSHVEPGQARFSHLGDALGPVGEHVRYSVGDGHVTVLRGGRPAQRMPGTIFDYLQGELRARTVDAPTLPFDLHGGYVGYFGYELKADCGATAAHRSSYPDAQWLFADRAVTVDHEQGRTYLLAIEDGTAAAVAAVEAWLDIAYRTLSGSPGASRPNRPDVRSDLSAVEPWLVRDRPQYLADIGTAQRKLIKGESYEICLTNALRIPAVDDGLQYYRRLRRANPAPYGAYLRFGGLAVACSSPERFLRIDADRVVESKPIKGTTARGSTPEEDERLRAELTTGTKTYAENLMIVDLLRNDLGRVCEVSSVHVPRLMATETYATVHQLVSTVRGTLSVGTDAVECIRACFPGGSMTGAPKLRTMEIIDSLEGAARGVYSGAIGFLGCDGTADLNIVIRTAVLHDGEWHIGAGGAIVLDSVPADEYDEMLLKAAATARAHPAVGAPGRAGAPA